MSEYRPDQEQHEQQQPETRIEPALVKKLLFPRDPKVRIQPEALEAASYLLEQFIIAARERASIDAQFDAENDDIVDDDDDNYSNRNDSSGKRQETSKSSAKRKRSVGAGIGTGSGTGTGGTGSGTGGNIIDITNIDEEFNTDISSDENGNESNSDTENEDLGNKKRTSSVEEDKRARKDHSTDIFIRPKHIMNIAAELLLDFT